MTRGEMWMVVFVGTLAALVLRPMIQRVGLPV